MTADDVAEVDTLMISPLPLMEVVSLGWGLLYPYHTRLFVLFVLQWGDIAVTNTSSESWLTPCPSRCHACHFRLRNEMRPLVRSYGESSTSTLSPGMIRIKFFRISPLRWQVNSWPLSSSTANIPLDSAFCTVPSVTIVPCLLTSCPPR